LWRHAQEKAAFQIFFRAAIQMISSCCHTFFQSEGDPTNLENVINRFTITMHPLRRKAIYCRKNRLL
jgi:hypothetical protein